MKRIFPSFYLYPQVAHVAGFFEGAYSRNKPRKINNDRSIIVDGVLHIKGGSIPAAVEIAVGCTIEAKGEYRS